MIFIFQIFFFLNVFDTLEALDGLNVTLNFLWPKSESLSKNGHFHLSSKKKFVTWQKEDMYNNHGCTYDFQYQDFIFEI